jgi:tetratricopeptide (TPR) repeat protein
MYTARVILRCAQRAYGALLLLLTVSTFSSAYQIIPPFWASKIDSGLNARDKYFKTVLPDTTNYSIVQYNKIQQSELCDRLLDAPDSGNQWYNFLLGTLNCSKEKSSSSFYFASALTLAQQDPGTTWALFVELTRNNQPMWAERCLMHLEKLMLASGAKAVPAIAQQLLFYATVSERQKDYKSAFSYYRWAEQFDPNQTWSRFHRQQHCFPSHPKLFFSTFGELVKFILNSWIVQLPVFAHLYTWISWFFTIFMLIVFTGTIRKYLPDVIHPIADRLPEEIPALLKTLLPMCMLGACLSFGILPFLWCIAFFIWPFVEKKRKFVVGLAIVILACAPLNARIQEMFRSARLPQSSLSLYLRASEEGYAPEIHRRSLEKIVMNRSDFLAQMTASLCALKQGDTAAASLCAQNALALRPNDPVAIVHAGNAAYVADDQKTATAFYQKILDKQPELMEARFNLAQCFARKSDTTIDVDFFKSLLPQYQTFINNFITTNDVYFSKNWPVLRQFMPPTYSPIYFWKYIFPDNNGSWQTTRALWGASFFGIPPYLSFYMSIALLLLFIVWHFWVAARRNGPPISNCRLCKRMICKSCKKGELCLSCFHATNFIRNVKTLANIQAKIIRNRRISNNAVDYLLDIVLPGAGMLFSKRHSFAIAFPIMCVTSILYASYFFLSALYLNYPHWVALGSMDKLPYYIGIYNLIFIVRAVLSVFRNKETVLV